MSAAAPLTALDLFCGAGGLSWGLMQAGWSVIAANEIAADFAASYRRNHPHTPLVEDDIRRLDFTAWRESLGIAVGQLDLLCGGPPCQGFSTVGAKRIHDERNTLFHEFLRAIAAFGPRTVLFENVAGFKRLYDGAMHTALHRELHGLGYDTTGAVLDAVDFGLPQSRKRTFVLAWRREMTPVLLPTPTHFPREQSLLGPPQRTLWDAIGDLPPLTVGAQATAYATPPQNDYQRALRGDEMQLTEHGCAQYGGKMQQILALIPPGGTVDDLPAALRPRRYFKNTYARLHADRPAPTITRNFGTPSSSRCVHPYQPRALSTREGARLQGFPDGYVFVGSKTAKNLQIGNAVPPLFGAILGHQMRAALMTRPRLSVRVG